MDSLGSLQQLIDVTRRAWRLHRARRAGAFTLIVVAIGILFIGWVAPHLPLLALIATGTAAVVGVAGFTFIRCRPSDRDVAQCLDERTASNDLLASAVACRANEDDASRSLIATAEQFARGVDRSRCAFAAFPMRIELAAGLMLVISLTISLLLVESRTSPSFDQTGALAVKDNASRTNIAGSSHGTVTQDTSADRSVSSADERESADRDDASRAGKVNAAPDRSAGVDAAGDGAASTDSRRPAVPTARQNSAATPKDGADHGSGLSSTDPSAAASDGRFDVTSASLAARRSPLKVSEAMPIDANTQAAAREALRGDVVPAGCRDLVRAYFDLDQD